MFSSILHENEKVSNLVFAQQTITDTKRFNAATMLYQTLYHKQINTSIWSHQCWVHSHITLCAWGRCTMLGLLDKPTLTPKVFNASFNPLPNKPALAFQVSMLGSIPHHHTWWSLVKKCPHSEEHPASFMLNHTRLLKAKCWVELLLTTCKL